MVWPRHGAPVILFDAFAENLVRRESWIAQVEVCNAYESALYGRVAELIADAGVATARIGFEQDGDWAHPTGMRFSAPCPDSKR
jgi:hypothetical protein